MGPAMMQPDGHQPVDRKYIDDQQVVARSLADQRQRRFAAAAGIAIAVIGLLLWASRGPSRSPLLVASPSVLTDRLGRTLPVASLHTLVRTPGAAYDAEIILPETPKTIALRVLPETAAQPPRYRMTLSALAGDDSRREIATIGNLAGDAEGFVPVYLNSFKLKRGRYRLVLSGEAGTSAADARSAFLIRIADDAS